MAKQKEEMEKMRVEHEARISELTAKLEKVRLYNDYILTCVCFQRKREDKENEVKENDKIQKTGNDTTDDDVDNEVLYILYYLN